MGALERGLILREVAAAARVAGKACGLLCRQTDDFAELQALGFTHLAIERDISLLRASYRKVIQPLREDPAVAGLRDNPSMPSK